MSAAATARAGVDRGRSMQAGPASARTRRPGAWLAWVAVAATLASGCAVSGSYVRSDLEPVVAEEPASEQVDSRILLVGDAGLPRLDRPEPVFATLAAEAARLPERTWVVFLGDNVYPHGLPAEDAGDRAVAERRLRAQVEAAVSSGARVVFVPGNHDYAGGGWSGMQRERDFLTALHEPRLQALPAGGCPGPEVVDAGARVRLVVLDSQWWLQEGDKPRDPHSPCPCDSEAEIVAAMRDALDSAAERRVVVVAHHPLASHGSHGGHFTWRQHIFPLVDWKEWAWLPLPVVGSLYPLSRQHGITAQDLSNADYRRMRESIGAVLRENRVLAYAAGHEHGLQLLELPGTAAEIVSGAGTVLRPEAVGRAPDTMFASGSSGFVRLDVLRDGRAWVQVVETDGDGRTSRPFAGWLEP